MHNDHSYNYSILNALSQYVKETNWNGMCKYLEGLSHSQFRTAGNLLGTDILPLLRADDFWTCFTVLFASSPKAWLVTLLKAAVKSYNNKTLYFEGECFRKICRCITENEQKIDKNKILQAILPILRTPQEVDTLFHYFAMDNLDECVDILLGINSLPCYFTIFQKLRRMDHRPEKISKYCSLLMQKGDDLSFNLVSIIKNYFDLPDVKGSFALNLAPFELSRLDTSYEEFKKIITCI